MESKIYLEKLFASAKIPVTENRRSLFEDFCKEEKYTQAVQQIQALQDMLMTDYKIKNRIADIRQQQVMIPNGTVGKAYEARLDFEQLTWSDFTAWEMQGLEATGLSCDPATATISGVPEQQGDFKILLKFKIPGAEAEWQEKVIPLIINPDPKSLWKDIPSDKEAPYWKEDAVAVSAALGTKHLVAASKRGRSHANVGSFRDDDFAFMHDPSTAWSVIAVSDGAGSARYSREGSRLACNSVLEYFRQRFAEGSFGELDTLLEELDREATAETQKKVSLFIYNQLGAAAKYSLRRLEAEATKAETVLNDFHATLIFTLIKKYEFGYAILSFGVGDCPIGLWYQDKSAVHLMNIMDVGEFGGGTRFITMPEIFQSNTFANRLGFRIVKDFDFLMLMTDGIYDPKFEVEANLEKVEKWQALLDDLQGNNPEKATVRFDAGNENIAAELQRWMDFWSPGNHDDRTLAILF